MLGEGAVGIYSRDRAGRIRNREIEVLGRETRREAGCQQTGSRIA